MDVSTLSIKDLVDKVNNDLGKDFCDKFRYKRKELSNSGRASSSSILFKFVDENRDWVINEGGGTEIQFHLYFRDDEIGFGLGFNAQYVPFANLKSPVDYIRPFVNAFLSLKDKGNEKILDLEKIGFSLIEGDWNGLRNITDNEYYLYGKKIQINGGSLSDDDYSQMLECIKKELFNLYVEIWKEKNDMENREEALKEYVSILTDNHNLILTGAPGTGKTYLAKQIAQQMIFGEVKEKMTDDEEKQFNEQCGFVQFHPSYDYTDFVEGLRPLNDDNGNVGFERKDGVFKEFCSKALSVSGSKNNFNEVWDNLISDVRANLAQGKLTKIGNWDYGLSTKESLKYSSVNTPSQYSFTITKKNIYDTYCGISARPSGAFSKDMLRIIDYMKDKYKLSDYSSQNEMNNSHKPFVFIIDEINRGEINKIFGELFFSIDPGYRGENGRVQTQYQNMVEDGDAFKKGFFVPENVYIIGTMNDIDRSVESMDFAFRRRFAFKEVTAKETQTMLDSDDAWKDETGVSQKPENNVIEKIKARMNSLNAAIEEIEGLSSAYHIGASYFLKLANYRDADGKYSAESFDKLWKYHLDGLLREYLRGMPKETVEKEMIKFEMTYNLKSAADDSSQDNG